MCKNFASSIVVAVDSDTYRSALGLISYGFSRVTPNYHPFSLIDLSISYPFKPDLVTNTDLILASVVAPIIIIPLVVLVFVPGLSAARSISRGELIRRKLWEWFIGWLGLALSLITQFVLVQGLKNAMGKPRPDMLARCDPDLANIARYTVGGFGQPITDRWVLVDQRICRQADTAILYDGFRSFPSGHAGSKSYSSREVTVDLILNSLVCRFTLLDTLSLLQVPSPISKSDIVIISKHCTNITDTVHNIPERQ